MTGPLVVTKPGLYQMAEEDYHADPVPGDGSLSASGAKLLLPPGCPATYAWARKHPRDPSRAMEFGTAAHRQVLGTGWPVAVWPGSDWTKLVDGVNPRAWREEQRAAGLIPILAREQETITAMAAAIEAHQTARLLLDRGEIMPEMSLFWVDDETGVWCRARVDAVKLRGRVMVVDYKTTRSADPDQFARDAANLGYHIQDAQYEQGVMHVLGDAECDFLFLAQEKEPPYVVSVFQLDRAAKAYGAERLDAARRKFARCCASGEWPGHQPAEDMITTIALPRWAARY